jgi:hypothetical protein
MSGVKELNLNKYLVQTSEKFDYPDLRDPVNLKEAYDKYKKKAMRNKTPIKSYDDWLFSDVPERKYEGKKNSSKIRKDVETEPDYLDRDHDHKKDAKQEINKARRAKMSFNIDV